MIKKKPEVFIMYRVKRQIGLTKELQTAVLYAGRRNPAVGVAVLDTGVSPHPDLREQILVFRDFVNEQTGAYDDSGHGTHVAGCVAGNGRLSRGIYSGMHPGCRLVVGKVLNNRGEGRIDHMIKAMEWILQNSREWNIRIVNISVGIAECKNGEKMKELLRCMEELWRSGIVVVCAAGNSGPDPMTISLLGAGKDVITVGCNEGGYFGKAKNLCEDHSGRGPSIYAMKKPDVVAPGTKIISCNSGYKKNPYIARSGTSMATPVVSGGLALLLQKNPEISNEEAKIKLLHTARDLGEPWNKQGWGMIQMQKLLK